MLNVAIAGASAKAAGLCEELAWVPLRRVESVVASVGAIDRGSVPLILAAAAPLVAYQRLDRSESAGCHEHMFVEEATGSAARVVLSTAPGGEVATAVAQVGPGRLWDQLRDWCTEYVRADGFLPSSWLNGEGSGRWQRAADVVAAALVIHDPDVRFTVTADEAAGQLVIAWSDGPCAEYVHWLARQVRPWLEVVYRYERTRTPSTPKVAA